MATIAQFILNTAKTAMSTLSPAASPFVSNPESSPPFHHPSPEDVLSVKNVMVKKFMLPLEIVDAVIDWAEYWPRTTVTTRGQVSVGGGLKNRADKLILRSLPLGYHADGIDDPFALPIEDFLAAQSEARPINESSISEAATEDLLKTWEARSSPRSEHPCRKIVFTIKSHDQGWASEEMRYHGTYQRSWTWFDVGLERVEAQEVGIDTPGESAPQIHVQQLLRLKTHNSQAARSLVCDLRTIQPSTIQSPSDPLNFVFEHPFLQTGRRLQSNLMAQRQAKEHIITWAYDDCIEPSSHEGNTLEEAGRGRETATGDLVRSLKIGDTVTIWARARFPGWINHVVDAKIDVYWAV